jgi:hypothetical protein
MAARAVERDAPSMSQAGTDSRQERNEEHGAPARRPRLEVVPGGRGPAESRHVFEVTLLDAGGAEWHAIGGGATVNEALAFAVASAPPGHNWRPVHWLELFGD